MNQYQLLAGILSASPYAAQMQQRMFAEQMRQRKKERNMNALVSLGSGLLGAFL